MKKITKGNNDYQKIKKSRKEAKREKVCGAINFLLIGVIMLVSGYYVATVNDLTIKGLKIQELKRQASQCSEENRGLTVEISSLKSYNSIVKRTQGLGMTNAEEINYIKVLRQTVAKK